MNIVIIGSGAVGGYFGAQLIRSSANIYFQTSNRSIEKIKAKGLTIEKNNGQETFSEINVLESTLNNEADSLVFDYIILAVKTYQLNEILANVLAVMSKNTRIIPLLNGISVGNELIAAGIPEAQIYGGLAKIISEKVKIGHIKLLGSEPHISFGLLDDVTYEDDEQKRLLQLSELFSEAKISHNISTRIQYAQWCKFLFVAAWGALASVLKMPIGDLREDEGIYNELVLIIKEYQLIGIAEGIGLGDEVVKQIEKFINALPAKSTTSMQRDIVSKKRSEFNALVEVPYQIALKHNLVVPVLKKCRETILGRVGPS